MRVTPALYFAVFACVIGGSASLAQPASPDAPKSTPARLPSCPNQNSDSIHTFYLHNIAQTSEANEIYTALRNMLPPDAKSFLVSTQSAILICAQPEQIALAQRLINDLDRAKKTYSLSYTLTELDGSKRIGSQRVSMIVTSGGKTSLRLGSRVPYATSTSSTGNFPNQHQFSYLDVGLNIEASVDQVASGVTLRSKVEQSSFATETSSGTADQKSGGDSQPVIRQTTLEGAASLSPGKPVRLGSLDFPGSSRHLDVEVTLEDLH